MFNLKVVKCVLLFFSMFVVFILGFIYFFGYKFNIYVVPPTPQEYVKVAIENMDDLGIFTDSKEWKKIKEQTLDNSADVKEYSDTIPILQKAIKVAGGKHSFIEDIKNISDKGTNTYIKPKIDMEKNILVLSIPEFTGNEKESQEYATILETALHTDKYKGVIIDLRGNRGGDMNPMILGISSILPDGNLFSYIDRNNNCKSVDLENGEINSGGSAIKVTNTTKIKKIPIAVLIDKDTGSSGELTALCLKGLSNAKFFGSDSAGYTSANQEVHLYDGSIMQITSAFIKDRTGKIYKNTPIEPDIYTTDEKGSAMNWIEHNE